LFLLAKAAAFDQMIPDDGNHDDSETYQYTRPMLFSAQAGLIKKYCKSGLTLTQYQ